MDEDRALFREALDAVDVPAVPDDFVDRVVAAMPARRGSHRARWIVLAVAASAVAAWGVSRRERRGEVALSPDATASRSVTLASRGIAVVEPGGAFRYRVMGVDPRHVDRVDLASGAVFFRVEGGGAFEVHTPDGVVRVTGTCFRVARASAHGDESMNNTARGGWFAAGALTVALSVTVYEGRVTLASARQRASIELTPGQSGVVRRDGSVARATPSSVAVTVPAADATRASTAPDVARAQEIARLRALLAAHQISPDTGEAIAANTAAPGTAATTDPLADPGNTDLTQDQWRTLAERGELRWRLPGLGGRAPEERIARAAHALGLRDTEIPTVQDAFRRAHEQLDDALRGMYREASGGDPGNLSTQALMEEIRDKTPAETISNVDWTLSQERGGLQPRQPSRADMSPYERMMRAMILYEEGVERELGGAIGPRDAHDILFGEHGVGGHSFGRTARRGM